MKSLPVPVSDDDIEEMFNFADKNKDDKLSYKEFEVESLFYRIIPSLKPYLFLNRWWWSLRFLRKSQGLTSQILECYLNFSLLRQLLNKSLSQILHPQYCQHPKEHSHQEALWQATNKDLRNLSQRKLDPSHPPQLILLTFRNERSCSFNCSTF